MNKFGIKNLRSFKDTGKIEIKPLTIAVGKNSSGKSTMLRIFPLFKQTFEVKVSEPILWYGRYVDFGDYNQAKNKENKDEPISFSFDFTIPEIGFYNAKNVSLQLDIGDNEIEEVHLKYCGYDIDIVYGEKNRIEQLVINGEIIDINTTIYQRQIQELLPTLYSQGESNIYDKYGMSGNRVYLLPFWDEKSKKQDKLGSDIRNNIELGKYITNYEEVYDYITNWYGQSIPQNDMVESMVKDTLFSKMKRKVNKESKRKYKKKEIEEYLINKLIENHNNFIKWALVGQLNSIIGECNKFLYKYFTNISYIAPIRANAERYYRIQGLDTEDVDCRGENIPMILKNMKSDEKKKFKEWMKDKFGFFIESKETEGHSSIYIYQANSEKEKVNIADCGFGYSQILPIILLIWKNKNTKKYKNKKNEFKLFINQEIDVKKMIVIEQPELHLHPKMQVQLIEVMIEMLKEDSNINFFIETHSQTIINYIGRKIEDEINIKNNVNVLLVEQKNEYSSTIRNVKYSEEGYLQDWPLDFFSGENWTC